jgi:putative transposase
MFELVEQNGSGLGIAPTCDALGVSRATFYRRRQPRSVEPRPASHRALSRTERRAVLDTLNSPRFVDQAPPEVYGTLLDEERYLCSIRTMYRILDENKEVRERRNQKRHPSYAAPELLATRPNELWSWDITKLLGPAKWTYYYLYVIMDVFSRYVVGWMVAHRESASLAEQLIIESCGRQGIAPQQLTLHADRGSSMRSKTVAMLLGDLGVTKTHSRPYTSTDNPYSEAHFRTLKYRPDFPDRFGSIEDGRGFCGDFFRWYNTEHRHWGLGLLTPHDVHRGLADAKIAMRAAVLTGAHAAHPERFPNGKPRPPALAKEVWINKPKATSSDPAAPRSGAEGCHRAAEMFVDTSMVRTARQRLDDGDGRCRESSPIMSAESEEVLL